MQDKKVLLSIKDLEVKFRVRGRVLTAIRGISLDIYENESIAIVGESGSGKSVFTKSFAGMLDSNGFISNGYIFFDDDELADSYVNLTTNAKKMIKQAYDRLNEDSRLELGAETWRQILNLESEKKHKENLTDEEVEAAAKHRKALSDLKTDLFNEKTTLNKKKEKGRIEQLEERIKSLEKEIEEHDKQTEQMAKDRKASVANDAAYQKNMQKKWLR